MHVTDWAEAQRKELMLSRVWDWLEAQKKTDLKVFLAEHASSEEGNLILCNQQNFTIHQGALHLCLMPNGSCSLWSLRHMVLPPWRVWSHLVPVQGMLLVAGDGWPNTEIPEVLHTLLAAWGQVVQGVPTPNCVHCSNGSLTCRLYKYRDNHGTEQTA